MTSIKESLIPERSFAGSGQLHNLRMLKNPGVNVNPGIGERKSEERIISCFLCHAKILASKAEQHNKLCPKVKSNRDKKDKIYRFGHANVLDSTESIPEIIGQSNFGMGSACVLL